MKLTRIQVQCLHLACETCLIAGTNHGTEVALQRRGLIKPKVRTSYEARSFVITDKGRKALEALT